LALRSSPYQGNAVVLWRRPPTDGGDVLVLSAPSITAKRLAAAAVFLTAVREEMGDEVSKVSMIPVPYTPGVDAMAVDINAAARSLEKLKLAPRKNVARLGDVQSTTIYLPNKAGREALRRRGHMDFSKDRGGRGTPPA
jgi:hypothetical protein